MTTHLLLRLYDWFARHRFLRLALPLVLVLAALASASQLHFKEDITDFLPNNDNYRRSMEIYRQTNAADRSLTRHFWCAPCNNWREKAKRGDGN